MVFRKFPQATKNQLEILVRIQRARINKLLPYIFLDKAFRNFLAIDITNALFANQNFFINEWIVFQNRILDSFGRHKNFQCPIYRYLCSLQIGTVFDGVKNGIQCCHIPTSLFMPKKIVNCNDQFSTIKNWNIEMRNM